MAYKFETGTISPEIEKLISELNDISGLVQDITGLPPINIKKDFEPIGKALADYWYSRIDTTADPRTQEYPYEVYDKLEYLYVTQESYTIWTRPNCQKVIRFMDYLKHTPKSFLDIFGGNGQSTVVFAKTYPDSVVYFHYSNTTQLKICQALCEKYGVNNVVFTTELVPTEMVLAFECLEHVLNPVEFILPTLINDEVLFFLDASSFTGISSGHFPNYVHENIVYPNNKIRLCLNKNLRRIGFLRPDNKNKYHHNCFYNHHPVIWVKQIFRPECQIGKVLLF